jgi:trans-aconitate methyltransferase
VTIRQGLGAASSQTSIWDEVAEQYTAVDEDRSRIVYPTLMEIISSQRVQSVLDFGAGDGRFAQELITQSLSWRWPVTSVVCYDPSREMRALAKKRLKDLTQARVVSKVPSGHWEVVTLNAVWMSLENDAACVDLLADIATRLAPHSGRLLAAVTHPCFRDRSFHSYSTDFDMRRYLDNGSSFDVHIYDGTKTVNLRDTHWNLEAMTRHLCAAGLSVRRIYELGDVNSTSVGAPWLLFEALAAK